MGEMIGIIGAGQMGNGIAQVCATAGLDVVMSDISMKRAEAGLAVVEKNLNRMIGKGKISPEDASTILSHITLADNVAALSNCDIVIEAATEDESVKVKIFEEVCKTLKPDALLASNTSSISITRLASSSDRAEQFMGVHFMNPVPVMKLVELIRGIATSDETFERFQAFVDKLGKTTAVSEDFPAFIVNRILLPMINESIYTLYEGVGTVTAIDAAMRMGANHPMGPLQLADFHWS